MRTLAEFAAALTLLTRLPAARLAAGSWPAMADCVWAYPVVGALVGAVGGAVFAFAPLPPAPAAVLALAAMVLLTGALHEDGAADTADGFGGGATAEDKRAIMRDSRIGSYGALTLIAAFGFRAAALAGLSHGVGAAALVAAGGLGRGAILIVLALLPPAADGSASPLGTRRPGALAAGLLLAAATALPLPGRPAWLAIAAALAAGLAIAWLARRQIGCYTGDVLGAASVAADCAVLAAISATQP